MSKAPKPTQEKQAFVSRKIATKLEQLERNAAWLARKVNVTPSSAWRWVNGHSCPSPAIEARIKKVLNINLEMPK